MTVKGPGGGGGFTATYRRGATTITGAVVAGSHALTLAPGASVDLTLRVRVGAGVADGARRSWLVVATSTGAGGPKDAVMATVNVS